MPWPKTAVNEMLVLKIQVNTYMTRGRNGSNPRQLFGGSSQIHITHLVVTNGFGY